MGPVRVRTRVRRVQDRPLDSLAITYHRQALALRPRGNPRATSLSNLANALSTRFEQLKGMEDLEEAIACCHQALALEPLRHPGRASTLSNLASVMTIRFRHSGSVDDLVDAAKHCFEAKNKLPTGHPRQSSFGSYLASILLVLCDIIPELELKSIHVGNAFHLFEQAVNHSPASVKDRFKRAVIWAREAHQRDHLSAVGIITGSDTPTGYG